eukprot:COSAG04_NODE_6365_length_1346_cov_1.201283_1_plen_82_part_00
MFSSLPRNLARPSATASRATALRSTAACFSSGELPSPTARLKSLRQLMESNGVVRVLEVHNGLTALIAEHATGADGSKFDG